MSDFAQSVKQQADIVRIIGEYVRLRKAGAQNYSGLCPFHKEKTPSFSVHSTRQFFHCFGCGVSGDVFTFIQKIENVSFPEAVRFVAQKCGIPLPKREFSSEEEAQEGRLRARLLELHEIACTWFEEQLRSPEGALAREYLSGRGLRPEDMKTFRIGYAPDNFHALRERMQALANTEILRLSGLFSFREQEDGSPGPLYSRFRKRVTFPIANESGRIIAFTARALEAGEKAGPKYLNSPETPLYSKSNVLFNLDKARQAIRELNFAVLVEGQMDCISAYLAGVRNVIATSGTAFTEAQVRLLGRYTKQVIVNFDPDKAGANAAEKSIALLTEEGFQVRVVTLEGGLDPDRYIREQGPKAYIAALRGAKRYQDYLVERARQLYPPNTASAKIEALNFLLPHIRRIPNRIARDEFAADAAQKLGIDSALVREELKQAAAKRRDTLASARPAVSEAEKMMLRALASPPASAEFQAAAAAFDANGTYFAGLTVSHILGLLRHRNAQEPMDVLADPRDRSLLAQALMDELSPLDTEHVAAALETLRRRYLERRQRELRTAIAEAERRGDSASVLRLTAEKMQVDRDLRA
ncbi:DNA primase [Pseudacidobacterium ailaaui]|uniref:DNA primase n=1 Tax=Pseudacidobacterium ailaaui TaxID=1382359 RepID=UPI00047E28D9|nr:DNA primase [Pseudacidobacterium ailaaui]